MLRKNRNSRSRRYMRNGVRLETDVPAIFLPAAHEEGAAGREVSQCSDSDSEAECGALSPPDPDAATDTIPVTGESYCDCDHRRTKTQPDPDAEGVQRVGDCLCGEDDQGFDWHWDTTHMSPSASLSCDHRKVTFHSEYSCGTAAVRGTRELADGQHFWEVKMTSPVYGTDMMVGVGTAEVNLEKYRHSFCSLLGSDEDSWGLSYTGLLHHKGDRVRFSSRFGQGSIIGLHLDTWHGTLTFYKNRQFIGVAASRLQNKKLYPMVCSTAAKSSMKVIRSCSAPTSLQYLCCSRLRRLHPACADALSVLRLPPGLRHTLHTQMGWVLQNGAPEELAPPSACLSPVFTNPCSACHSPANSPTTCPSQCSRPVTPSSAYSNPILANPGSGCTLLANAGSGCPISADSSCAGPSPTTSPIICPRPISPSGGCSSLCPSPAPSVPCSCPSWPCDGACLRSASPSPGSEADDCSSDPEACQRKRCRWM